MKIGLIGQFSYPCSIERYYLRALEDLGHHVICAPLYRLLRIEDIDLIIVVKWIEDPLLLKKATCPTVLIFTDLTSRFKAYYNSVQEYFDYVFLVHNETDLIDNKRVFYLPVGFCPHEHFYVDRTKKDIDALFIGTCHPNREFLRDIHEITRFGNGWGNTTDVYGDKYREFCSRAKIIINSHYPGDTTNMRDYEAMNFRAVVLTDKTPFTPGKDVIKYYNDITLKEDIAEILSDECWNYDYNSSTFYQSYAGEVITNASKTIKSGKFKYKDRMEEMLSKISGVGP